MSSRKLPLKYCSYIIFLSGNHMPNLKKIMFDFSWHRHSPPFLAYDIPKIIFLAAFFTLL